jgi:hypothetical protein
MLERLTRDLAAAVATVDARQPIAVNKKSGASFEAGLGPHSETETFALILTEAQCTDGTWLLGVTYSVPYPHQKRQRCDARVVTKDGTLFLEAKLLRLKGDNGKPNDNMLMHILSPYPQHRSVLTDCLKLSHSGFGGQTAVVILGYSYPDMSLEPAVNAFETLAGKVVKLGKRFEASFSGLCHRVHREGKVMAWQIE